MFSFSDQSGRKMIYDEKNAQDSLLITCITLFALWLFFSPKVDTHGQPGCLGCGCRRPAGSFRLLAGWRAQEQQAKRRGYGQHVSHLLAGTALHGECPQTHKTHPSVLQTLLGLLLSLPESIERCQLQLKSVERIKITVVPVPLIYEFFLNYWTTKIRWNWHLARSRKDFYDCVCRVTPHTTIWKQPQHYNNIRMYIFTSYLTVWIRLLHRAAAAHWQWNRLLSYQLYIIFCARKQARGC